MLSQSPKVAGLASGSREVKHVAASCVPPLDSSSAGSVATMALGDVLLSSGLVSMPGSSSTVLPSSQECSNWQCLL